MFVAQASLVQPEPVALQEPLESQAALVSIDPASLLFLRYLMMT